jgi:hypothetical protein
MCPMIVTSAAQSRIIIATRQGFASFIGLSFPSLTPLAAD